MALDDNLCSIILGGLKEQHLPFAAKYLENPEPIGASSNVYDWTSVTFCTWKWIPTVDDGD